MTREARIRRADEAASVAHDFIYGLNDVTKEQADKAIWTIHEALRPILGEPSRPPEQRPNAGNRIKIHGSTIYLDSPTQTHGVKVNARQDEGWLTVKVDADESVRGWALSYNGHDHPTTDDALRARLAFLEGALRYYTGFGGEAGRHAREALDA